MRRKVSTGALDGSAGASDDEDDEDDDDGAGVDGDAVASRARHRSPPAPSARKRKTQSRGASAALLAARALVASAFLAAGAARVYDLGTDPEFDGALGTLLPLAQLALAVPLAAGYGVGATARAAAACLALEAFSRFDFGSARARAHCAADVACAGGLVLLRAMGGGGGTPRTHASRRLNGSEHVRACASRASGTARRAIAIVVKARKTRTLISHTRRQVVS